MIQRIPARVIVNISIRSITARRGSRPRGAISGHAHTHLTASRALGVYQLLLFIRTLHYSVGEWRVSASAPGLICIISASLARFSHSLVISFPFEPMLSSRFRHCSTDGHALYCYLYNLSRRVSLAPCYRRKWRSRAYTYACRPG